VAAELSGLNLRPWCEFNQHGLFWLNKSIVFSVVVCTKILLGAGIEYKDLKLNPYTWQYKPVYRKHMVVYLAT
jgi:hypothetical protein